MRNYNLQFRPQDISKQARFRMRMNGDKNSYSWVPHKSYTQRLKGKRRPLNEEFMGGVIFARIHYLTSHAPTAVTKRWKQAAVRWKKKFGPRAGTRFANKFTINRWL